MSSSSSSEITYRPTPLERAYASYLLETYFDIPFNTATNNNSGGVDEEIRLSGRTAVSFYKLIILLWEGPLYSMHSHLVCKYVLHQSLSLSIIPSS